MSEQQSLDAAGSTFDELSQRRFALMARQVRAMRWSFVAIIAMMVALTWRDVPRPLGALWGIGALLTQALRGRWLTRHAERNDEPASRKIRLAVAWNCGLGLVFGSSALFMIWLDRALSAVLTTIVVSTAAGAVAISGPLLPVYLAYTVSIMVPFAVVWALTGGWLGFGLTVLMGVFVGVQFRFARQVSAMFTESFVMRQANEELVRQLTLARDQADSASRAKTRFLAAASHDLRQPLHALSLQSSALLLDPFAEDTPQIVGAMAQSIESVSALLDSLLDISKLDAGTLVADKRPIYLSRLMESLARSFRPWVEGKGLQFEFECSPQLIAVTDPLLLERVLRNLVDNAVKFTRHGKVSLALCVVDDVFEICISDTGVGIAEEAQTRVFEEFFQIDRRDDGQARGLGLGLSIVSRLAALLGISVELHSTVDVGTTIRLCLPRVEAEVPQPAAAVQQGDLRGLRVLVLDDEPAIRNGMATLLRRLGCDVSTASCIAEAQRQARSFEPRVLLADYRLQDEENGIDAVARLRAEHGGLLALLISGDTTPDRLREASESGLELLHKPVSLELLRRSLSTLVLPRA